VARKYAQGDPPALDIKELDIPGGEVVALIGISGSGKTTLLNILGLLDEPDRGAASSIRLDGRELLGLTEAESRRLRGSFGFVFQQGYLLENLPSRENVRIPPQLQGLDPLHEDIKKMLGWVNLGNGEGARRPGNLSAGQRQRIAVLRALSHGPKVVFADEPTSSLDKENAEGVLQILREWCKGDRERTVLLVTHDTAAAVKYADRAILMSHGRAGSPFPLEGVSAQELNNRLATFTEAEGTTEHSGTPDEKKGPLDWPRFKRSRSPRLAMFGVCWKMAWHDIFSRVARTRETSWFRRLFPFRMLQFQSMASLSLALLLALFFARLFLALSGYLVHSVSDPRMNQILVLRHRTGAKGLDGDDLKQLASLAWIDGKIRTPPPGKKVSSRSVIIMASPARNVQISAESARCEYPRPCSPTMLAVSVPVTDKILAKIPVLEGPNIEQLKESRQSIRSLFVKPESRIPPGMDPDLIPDEALDPVKFGIVCTPGILKTLGYDAVPAALKVTFFTKGENRVENLPVLGTAWELPADKEAMITEGLFLQEYFKGGLDPEPDYNQISLYVKDLLGDGLPLCDTLAAMDYAITEGERGKLEWVVRLIGYIEIFALVASAGLLIVVLGQLTKSFWEAIRRKEREIGVLLAYGIRFWDLALTFWLEVAIIWCVAALCAAAFDATIVARAVALAYRSVPNAGQAPVLPMSLWASIVFGSLAIATASVVPALRAVDARRVANMLKAVN